MNRLLPHRPILLFALCSALVSSLIPVLVLAEQPDVAQPVGFTLCTMAYSTVNIK